MSQRKRKLFVGSQVRKIRQQHQVTQADLAQQLGISPSYLNQIENNQRPLTVPVLLALGQLFNLDLAQFSSEAEDRLSGELRNILDDPLFIEKPISAAEIQEVIQRSPDIARHFVSLYESYQQVKQDYLRLAHNLTHDEAVMSIDGPEFPHEEVREFFYRNNNYFHELDEAAEALFRRARMAVGGDESQLLEYLQTSHGITVVVDRVDTKLRHFETRTRTLYLSRLLSQKQRLFQIAHQLCLLEQSELLDTIIKATAFTSEESDSLCRVGLANYYAGALLMPYTQFYETTQRERYDIERLQVIFNCSFEQVCHRLSTLQKADKKGVPFYFLRVDMAGNISKRQSATSFHFARIGGACPLWNVHEAFSQPGKILRQIAVMPDGKRYFCIARTVNRAEGGYLMPQKRFAVALGCEISHAPQLIYSVGLDLQDEQAATPIGVSCRVCERDNCPQRAFPPIGRRIVVNEDEREFLPYQFVVDKT